ncbi:hypothetical protein BM1_02887 [Bipolaris maydis]|nr:hypothetical protein BM1_02887 [Bipolaris maydis]
MWRDSSGLVGKHRTRADEGQKQKLEELRQGAIRARNAILVATAWRCFQNPESPKEGSAAPAPASILSTFVRK